MSIPAQACIYDTLARVPGRLPFRLTISARAMLLRWFRRWNAVGPRKRNGYRKPYSIRVNPSGFKRLGASGGMRMETTGIHGRARRTALRYRP